MMAISGSVFAALDAKSRDRIGYAAAAAGMSFETWIDDVVVRKADALNIEIRDLTPAEGADAVLARLDQLDDYREVPGLSKARRSPAPQKASWSQTAESFEQDIDGLLAKLEKPQAPLPKIPAKARLRVDSMRDAVADITARQRDLAGETRPSPAQTLKSEIVSLANRLATPVEPPALRDPRDPIRALEQRVETLGRDLDGLRQSAMDSTAWTRLVQQTSQIHDLVQNNVAQPPVFTSIEMRLDELNQRVERLSRMSTSTPAADTTALAEKFGQSVDRKLASFASRFGPETAPPTKIFDDLSHQLTATQKDVLARLDHLDRPSFDARPLEAMLREIATKLEPSRAPDLSGFEDALRTLASRVETSETRAAAPLELAQTLVGEVRSLAGQIASGSVDRDALSALRSDLDAMTRRLERDEPQAAMRSSFEHSIDDLLKKLDDTRDAAVEAAEATARRVAQSAVEAALAANGEPPLDAVHENLADLRSTQATADRRVRATLVALSETLGTAVERIGHLERGAPVAAEPAVAIKASDATDDKRDQATFIAAARRATRAPSSETAPPSPMPPEFRSPGPRSGIGSADEVLADIKKRAREAVAARAAAPSARPDAARSDLARTFIARHKKPLVLSLASVIALVGVLQTLRSIDFRALPQRSTPAAVVEIAQPAAPTREALLTSPKADVPAAPFAPPTSSAVPAAQTFQPRPPVFTTGATDRTAVGTIPVPSVVMPPGPSPVRDAANAGDPIGQYELALRYTEGRGVPRDVKLAAQWFEKAAAGDLAPAQYRTGLAYEKGAGVTRDVAAARLWYRKAADQGNIRAMHNLAVLTAEGDATIKADYPGAADLFRKAALFGVRDSQYNLAILYARGLGVAADLGQSYRWFALAALQGDEDAAKKRDDVAARLNATGLATAKASVETFKPLTANAAANEVPTPPGGWDNPLPKPPTVSSAKPVGDGKMTSL